jgi:hypothetical protein
MQKCFQEKTAKVKMLSVNQTAEDCFKNSAGVFWKDAEGDAELFVISQGF